MLTKELGIRTADVYRALRSSGCIVPHQELNWENFAPPRVRVFFWILRGMQPSPRNTVVLSLLWAVWKSRNRMVFDHELLSATQVASMSAGHLRLWVVRAPPHVDLALLHSWCDSVS
jgi:hypothetical protein